LQISGVADAVWLEIVEPDGRRFVIGEPGEVVDILVIHSKRRALCPTCRGDVVKYYTPPGFLVPSRAALCPRCKGRGFVPITELSKDETKGAILDRMGTVGDEVKINADET